ncbi:MAG: hypothetical protein LBV54_01120, partial [Puniceicoccales bacterium]|nr:hypothetical protein [Puniceicoccales bacterium]
QKNENIANLSWDFYIFYDSPLRFFVLINHGEPEYSKIPAKINRAVIGKWESFCYLGEMQNFTACKIKKDNMDAIVLPQAKFGKTSDIRVCVFMVNNAKIDDLSVKDFYERVVGDNKIKVILENEREFVVDIASEHWPFLFYTLPKEAGDSPVKSFEFKRLPDLTHIAFNIPSLIEFFPENKGIKNRFDLKIPTKFGDPSYCFSEGLGVELGGLDVRLVIKGWYICPKSFSIKEDTKFNFFGKTYREALIEYIQAHDGLSTRNVLVDTNEGRVSVKTRLSVRLLWWLQAPTLERWPWGDPWPGGYFPAVISSNEGDI